MKLAPLILVALVAGCAPASDSSAQGAAGKVVIATTPPPAGAPRLSFPLDCRIGTSCALQNHMDRDPGPEAKDYRCGRQTYQDHSGVDIRVLDLAAQRAGVDVLAAAPGTVARLRDGMADISVRAAGAAFAAGQDCGNGVVIDHGGGWETQYCHLAQGSVRVKVGEAVTAGQPIARVGLSGNTEYPHLHLTVRQAGTTIDPFAPTGPTDACDPAAPPASGLWDAAAASALAYRRGVVLNAGFSATPVSREAAEAGGVQPPTARSPALIAYIRAINLEAGDIQEMTLKAPDGGVLARSVLPPLDRAKAEYVMYAGKRMPPEGWPPGDYTATYSVRRDGKVAITRTFNLRL